MPRKHGADSFWSMVPVPQVNGIEPMTLIKIVTAASLALAIEAPGAAMPLPRQQHEIALRVARPGLSQCTSHHPDGTIATCLPRFSMRPGRTINGWSAGGMIAFSTAAVSLLDADAFALLAGHEIAHWYLGHAKGTPDAELAADRLGAALACQAGFDVARGLSLFRDLHRGRNHPRPAARIAAAWQGRCGINAPARAPDSSR